MIRRCAPALTVGVALAGDLDGRGLAGEDQQAVAGGMAGEVHENIDVILAANEFVYVR